MSFMSRHWNIQSPYSIQEFNILLLIIKIVQKKKKKSELQKN